MTTEGVNPSMVSAYRVNDIAPKLGGLEGLTRGSYRDVKLGRKQRIVVWKPSPYPTAASV